MADKDITIGIKTTGAEKSAAEINKLPKAIDKVDKANKGLSETQQRSSVRAFEAVTDKARVTEFAYYNLGEEIQKTQQKNETFTAGTTEVTKGTGNASRALLSFSQGFEDAQYGIRGVLNNIPGLVLALGGTAGLAGVISIAAVSLSVLGEQFKGPGDSADTLAEKAEKTKEKIEAMTDAMKGVEEERFDGVIQEFEDLRAASEAVADQTDLTKAADRSFAVSALENAVKQESAIKNLIAALGLQLDKTKELQANAAAEQAKREETARQAIEIEQEKIVKAQEAQTKVSDILGERSANLDVEKATLVELQAQLETLRAQREELEKRAKATVGFAGALAGEGAFPWSSTYDADQAQKQLDSPQGAYDQSTIEVTANRIEELAKSIKTQERSIIAMENALKASIQLTQDTEAAVGTKVAELNAALEKSTFLAKTETLLATEQATAEKLTEVYSQIETTNAAGEAAKQTILAAAADGKVTADEQKGIADDVRTVIGQVQSGQASTKGNLQELINLQKSMAQQAVADGQLIRQHSAQINQLFQRLR